MPNLVINTERLFDGDTLKDNVSVLITNGIIAKVGKKGDFKGKIINTKFLSPGLVDMHMHLTPYGSTYADTINLFSYFNKLLIYNGITTVRDVGNSLNNIYNLKYIKDPKPRIFPSILLDGDKPLWGMSFIVKNERQVKEVINNYNISEIKWVKAYQNIKPKLLKSIIREAHSKKLKVAGDLLATGPEEAVRMQIDTLEHITRLINKIDGKTMASQKEIYEKWAKTDINSRDMDRLVKYLSKSGTALCPTLIVAKMGLFPSMEYRRYLQVIFPLNKSYKQANPKTRFTKINKNIRETAFENILKLTGKLHREGVKLIVGSDSSNPFVAPGFSLHQELKLLVEAGLTPMEALRAATSEAAKVLGTNKIGYIKPGAKADMVLFSEFIDSDINKIDKITYTILNGKPIKVDLKDLLSKPTLMKFLPKKTL